VLFIEDSAVDYALLVRLLEQAGHRLVSVRVENDAGMREALARESWDVVISDHNLPEFSSTAALATLKSTGMDIPFLIVSGEIGEDIAVEAMLAGADDYILKSRLGRLVPALARSLAASRARRRERDAGQALKEREARLRSITANLPGIVFRICLPAGEGEPVLDYISEGVLHLLGHAPGTLTGPHTANFFALFPDPDREDLLHALDEAGDEIRWEGRALARDGSILWTALAGSPRTADSETMYWEGVITDITAQKEAESRLRELAFHLEHVKEDERRSIAREIHDDIGGILTGLKFDLAWMRARATDPNLQARLDGSLALLASARAAAERIMHDLRPAILEQGIVAALEWQARDFSSRFGVECLFRSNRETVDLPEELRMALFRICQEALTNAAKHALARRVKIELFASDRDITLEIADDGAGIADQARKKSGSYGLRNMQERAAALGGWLDISSAPGRGTTIMLSLPLSPSNKEVIS
jgi:PAS domain S-box-containing protein